MKTFAALAKAMETTLCGNPANYTTGTTPTVVCPQVSPTIILKTEPHRPQR